MMSRMSKTLAGLLIGVLFCGVQAVMADQSSDAGLLPAPQGLSCTPKYGAMLLRWAKVEGSGGYRIYWAKKGALAPASALIDEVQSEKSSYIVRYLLPGVEYSFQVAALNSCVQGNLSSQVSAAPFGDQTNSAAAARAISGDTMGYVGTALSRSPTALSPPKGFTATPQVGSVLLQWRPVAGSSGYRIYFEREGAVNRCSARLEDIAKDQASYRIENLSPGVPYYFRISTLIESTEGPMSIQAGAIPKTTINSHASDGAD